MKQTEKYHFSIVVPVYLSAPYLERCVTSLVGQESAEIILVNDGSPDESGAICDQYAEKYEQVQVVHKENGGLATSRNSGIEHAQGKYILAVDADDYAEPQMCSLLWKHLKNAGFPDVVFYGAVEENGTQKSLLKRISAEENNLWQGRKFVLDKLQHKNMNVQSWMYGWRKDFLDEHQLRYKKGALHEDVEFTLRALLQASDILELQDVLYHYIVRENSISTQKDKTKDIVDIFRSLDERAKIAQGLDPELAKWINNSIVNSYLNMVQEAQMYQKRYRKYLNKSFLWGKSATISNHLRVLLFTCNVYLYCKINDLSKKIRK